MTSQGRLEQGGQRFDLTQGLRRRDGRFKVIELAVENGVFADESICDLHGC